MRKSIHLSVALAMLASLGATTQSSAAESCVDGATLGCFDAPFSENGDFDAAAPNTIEEAGRYPTAVSIAVLPDGRMAYWDGLTDLEESPGATVFLADYLEQADRSRILDLGTDLDAVPLITEVVTNNDGGGDQLFCADQRLAQDGRLIAAGGTKYANQQSFEGTPLEGQVTNPNDGQTYSGMGTELFGSKHTRQFTADTHSEDQGGAWKRVGDMHWLRWYPSMLTMPDGDMFIAGGVSKLVYNSSLTNNREDGYEADDPAPRNVEETEVFDLETNTWTENPASAKKSLPLFARLHMLPSGEIAFLANGQQFNPMGQDVDQLSWNNQSTYNPTTKTWTDIGVGRLGARSGAADVLMRLEPNASGEYDNAKVLMAGGTLGVSPGTHIATPLTEIVSLSDSDDNGAWEATTELGPMLNNPRWYSTAVNLPTGDVIVFSGGNQDDVLAPGSAKAIRQAELFNGTEWVPLATAARDRVYHNTAILLKDGSVLLGGHAPINQGYGGANTNFDDLSNGMVNSNLRDPSFERYYPPYLNAGPRPVLDSVSATTVSNGDSIDVTTSGADATEFVLSRLPSQTHATDADARTVKLNATGADGSFSFDVPGSTVVPPGYYYLFAISADGVPSIASTINVTS